MLSRLHEGFQKAEVLHFFPPLDQAYVCIFHIYEGGKNGPNVNSWKKVGIRLIEENWTLQICLKYLMDATQMRLKDN